MKDNFSMLERFYTHFIGRDLSLLFSGGLLLSIVEYTFFDEIFISKGLSLEVIGFLVLSYFIGYTFHFVDRKIKISGKLTNPIGYSHDLLFIQDFLENYNEHVFNRYERYIFMLNCTRYVGISSLLGGVIMILSTPIRLILNKTTTFEYIFLIFSFLFFGIIMIMESRYWNDHINFTTDILGKKLKKY